MKSKIKTLSAFFLLLSALFTSLNAQPCLECLDEPFDAVCAVDADGNVFTFPNACFAECEGYTEDDFVECSTGGNGGFDCFECLDEPFEPVCVEDSDGNVIPFPNACFAECGGYSPDDFVECDSTVIGGGGNCDPPVGGGDCVECLDEPFELVCVEDSLGNVLTFPNACFAECVGFSSDDFVECDSTIFGGGNGGLDCIECLDEPFDPVCVEDADGNVFPFPNACFAECEGYTSDDFVECDSTIIGGGNCDPPGGWDCIECLDEPFDPVCVEDADGNVFPFPNACFAECEGYTSDDFVECDSTVIGGGNCDPPGGWDCIECFDEPFDPVCVEDAEGNEFPFPNACFAECKGYTSDDFVSCESLDNPGNDIDLLESHPFTESSVWEGNKIKLLQNPVIDVLKVIYDVEEIEQARSNFKILDLSGKVILQKNIEASEGTNRYNINLNDLQPGIYFLNLETSNGYQTIKFVK